MINVELELCTIEEKETFKRILQYYIYDFSEYTETDINSEGHFNLMPEFNDYWEIKELYKPFLVRTEGKLVGFVLVQKIVDTQVNYLKHFFVLRKYRKQGIGRLIAYKTFELFNGEWKVSELLSNEPSQIFWNKVINEYTQGNYKDFIEGNRRIQTFVR